MEKTIFEKIIDREIPADIVYEDDLCLGFLDISPVKKGHTLLVSKKPYPWVQDVPNEELSHMIMISKKIILGMKKSIHADYVQIGIVGTEVPHFHIHLIPHMKTDKVETSHNRPIDSYKDINEQHLFRDAIKNSL